MIINSAKGLTYLILRIHKFLNLFPQQQIRLVSGNKHIWCKLNLKLRRSSFWLTVTLGSFSHTEWGNWLRFLRKVVLDIWAWSSQTSSWSMKKALNQTPRMEQVLLQKHRGLDIHQSVPISRITVDVPLPPVVQSNHSCAHVLMCSCNVYFVIKSTYYVEIWKVCNVKGALTLSQEWWRNLDYPRSDILNYTKTPYLMWPTLFIVDVHQLSWDHWKATRGDVTWHLVLHDKSQRPLQLIWDIKSQVYCSNHCPYLCCEYWG